MSGKKMFPQNVNFLKRGQLMALLVGKKGGSPFF
jgi:hypothetical protein